MPFNKQYGGPDCITCCEVEVACDCTLLECIMDFYRYALNANQYQYTGHLSDEVAIVGMKLVGFAALASYERPVRNGAGEVDFGRSLTQALINEWDVKGSVIQTEFQEIERIFGPYLDEYLITCGCDEENANRIDCQALKCVMDTIMTFGRIGLEPKPPFTLEEWANGGLCGVCYTDCNGDNYTFSNL